MLRRTIYFNLALLLLLLTGSHAQAHTDFVSSNPSDGSVVQSFPSEISLTFNEELLTLENESVNAISLFGPDGIEIPLSSAEVTGANLVVTVVGDAAALPTGKYRVAYRVVSTDGHPVNGEIKFDYAPEDLSPNASQSPMPIAEVTPETSATSESTAINFSFIAPFILIILIIGALLIIRKKR